jgi:acyl-CoA ligase (AMP-forming) (exosortase A-associated)
LITLFDVLRLSAEHHPTRKAVVEMRRSWSFTQLLDEVMACATGLARLGVKPGDRVAIFADKRAETLACILAATALDAIFVPVNPQLKPKQVLHILNDSGARVLLTTPPRWQRLRAEVNEAGLQVVAIAAQTVPDGSGMIDWPSFRKGSTEAMPRRTPTDQAPAAILYTSGSTGAPKGVVLSHRNLVAGAFSIAEYLGLGADDVVLGALPISFDAGLSQLTTAIAVGAAYAPLDFLSAAEAAAFCEQMGVTAITAVPPLWMQLVRAPWTDAARQRLRIFANTGGHMPRRLLSDLRALFCNARPYLMYGLTEAFRSTYLDPAKIDLKPDSIGQAAPNVEIKVLRPDGSECAVNEPGELVHRGAFVTLGYWNAPELTARRFRPVSWGLGAIGSTERAVWSSDIVRRDEDGDLYFVTRADDQIKTSGYRVSPTEIEELLFDVDGVEEAAAFAVPHPELGEAIAVSFVAGKAEVTGEALIEHCKRQLPSYMVPRLAVALDVLPRNANGKIDRSALKERYRQHFERVEA